MPILVEVSKGLLTDEGEREVFPKIAAALLEAHGLTGNAFMAPNVIGHLSVKPESECFVGGKPQSLAVIEVTVPAITFPNGQVAQKFIGDVTDVIDQYKANAHPRERTYVVVKHAVDGPWGIGGKAYTNEELGAAIQKAALA
jgi:phenylpyruvate tautomerase PptA (4-oxalocrotonate tautomerase family)